jgi:hypothetical protein
MKRNLNVFFWLSFALLTLPAVAQVPAYVPTDGLVGWWPFNGNANDESGNGHDGTVNGATLTEDRFGLANSAYSFDGTDITIPIANTSFQGDFTISLWVQLTSFYSQCSGACYPTFLQGENCYFDLGYVNSAGYANNQSGVSFSFSQGCAVGEWSGSVSRAVNVYNWSHISVVGKDALVYLYLDGNLVDLTEQEIINQSNTLGSYIKIGRGNWSYQYFIGQVDDLAIYERAITPEEVSALYGETGPVMNECTNLPSSLSEGLMGYWPLCGNAEDVSGNENHGLAIGATPALDRFNNPSGALYFANELYYDKDWVKIPIDSMLVDSDYTISVWTKLNLDNTSLYPLPAAYPAVLEGDQCFMTNTYGLSSEYSIGGYYEAGSCSSDPSGPGWSSPINPANWAQISLVSKNDSTSFYVNGSYITTVESSNQSAGIGRFLKLGRGHVSQDLSIFNGWLDDLAIYNRALSSAEIQELFTGEPATPPTACTPLPSNLQQGLVGYWPFCGNANDESGNGNDGTVNGATLTEDRFGNLNSAFYFNGVSDNIRVFHDSMLNSLPITISAWFREETFTGRWQPLVNKLPCQSNNGYAMHLNLGHPSAYYYSNNDFVNIINLDVQSQSLPIPASGEWHLLTISISDSTFNYYLDGVNFLASSFVGNMGFVTSTISDLYFGKVAGPCIENLPDEAYHHLGSLDDIGIWNRALTPEEVQELYSLEACTFTIYDTLYTYETLFDTLYTYETVVDTLYEYETITTYDTVTTYLTVTDTLIIDVALGIAPNGSMNTLLIYPNPASNLLTIHYGNFAAMDGYTLTIFNNSGSVVHTTPINQQQETLNLALWSAGSYQVVIYNSQGVPIDTRTIVIQ